MAFGWTSRSRGKFEEESFSLSNSFSPLSKPFVSEPSREIEGSSESCGILSNVPSLLIFGSRRSYLSALKWHVIVDSGVTSHVLPVATENSRHLYVEEGFESLLLLLIGMSGLFALLIWDCRL